MVVCLCILSLFSVQNDGKRPENEAETGYWSKYWPKSAVGWLFSVNTNAHMSRIRCCMVI